MEPCHLDTLEAPPSASDDAGGMGRGGPGAGSIMLVAAHGSWSQGDVSQPSSAQMLSIFRKLTDSVHGERAAPGAALKTGRDSECEAPLHKAWRIVSLQQTPLRATPAEGHGVSESEVPQNQAIVFPTKPPTLLHTMGSSTAPSPGAEVRVWVRQQQPRKCSSFTVPQQALCSPPLAQALSPLRSPELKGTR